MSYRIEITRHFEREAKPLLKKYASLKSELNALGEELKENPEKGAPLGNNLYKIHLAIASKGKGKSGGARVITYLKTEQGNVYLLSIYDKGDRDSLSDKEIKDIFNVEAALRGWRLTAARAGCKTCKFALTFGRVTPPLTQNRPLCVVHFSSMPFSLILFPLLSVRLQYRTYFQSGSFSQSAGKLIARISTVGYSANNDLSFCVNRLLGETVKSKYLITQMR